jgi:hypothetical protein
MSHQDKTLACLLLSYVGLLADRHGYAPGENFEFLLWDDVMRATPTLVSIEEKQELVSLTLRTEAWVTYDFESRMWRLIDLEAWRMILEHRDH